MRIFQAVVTRINEIPAQNGAFSQREIIVIPYSTDGEIATEYVAVPPSIFPTDVYGSGTVSLPDLNQRCIVAESANAGDRKVNILSYMVNPATSSFGEYTPVNVSQGGAVFKIGGVRSMNMFFHKGGKFELFSTEFCNFYLDGTKKKLYWSIEEEERLFAGGRILNTKEELDGAVGTTRHVEIYTATQEWKQNSDIRLGAEKSIMNPSSSVVPTPTYSYVPKVIIKAGTITNEFTTDLGKVLGHVYQLETRQSRYGDKDTVTVLRLGRQSEMSKYDNSNIYSAGTMLEWTGKTAQITSETSRVSTYLFSYGQQEKDVISNGVPIEYTQGEVYRNQLYINIVEPLGTPLFDNMAEGKGYEFNFKKTGVEQQYLQSFGRLTSENLTGNADYLAKSAVREHFHTFEGYNASQITTPTGNSYDFIFSGDNGTEKNIFLRKFSKIEAGIEKIFHKEQFTELKYEKQIKNDNMPNHSAYYYLDAQEMIKYVHIGTQLSLETNFEQNLFKNYVKLDNSHTKTEEMTNSKHETTVKLGNQTFLLSFTENCIILKLDGPGPVENSIFIGGNDFAHKLVTKEWVDLVFKTHLHPTAGTGPPSPPIAPDPISVPSSVSHLTYITEIE